jgi:hypothetical protein
MPGLKRLGGLTMGSFSIWHWLIVLLIIVLIFYQAQEHQPTSAVRSGLQGRHQGAPRRRPAPPAKVTSRRAPKTTIDVKPEQVLK